MPHGLTTGFTIKSGQRDTVVAQLATADRELSTIGYQQYIVEAAYADEVLDRLTAVTLRQVQANAGPGVLVLDDRIESSAC